jgi:hypothetical protein
MTKLTLFRVTLIVTVVMMMVGGALMTAKTVGLGVILVILGIAGFVCSPFISQLGKDDNDNDKI